MRKKCLILLLAIFLLSILLVSCKEKISEEQELRECIDTCINGGKDPTICQRQCSEETSTFKYAEEQTRCGDGVCEENEYDNCAPDCGEVTTIGDDEESDVVEETDDDT